MCIKGAIKDDIRINLLCIKKYSKKIIGSENDYKNVIALNNDVIKFDNVNLLKVPITV